ncbi:serine/threonine-protein kinase [Streptomyces sp. NPDC005931]|uniref:serine/threonine-protein kinase n=1 Tax=Streptomyces sp. NPDC005931 TaxID=3364737 RepID=UPI0036B70D5E
MNDGEPGRRVIDGRFELQTRLGGGGMGTVWQARDVVLDRAVALKEVRPPDPGLAEYDPEAAALLRARVLREARALARVEHPNVVTIHHVVDGAGHAYPWLVMELVTGGSLADLLARGPMEPRQAARLGRGILSALMAAHAVGIQHRDVKPANVLLRPDGRPVLTDFGIAAIRESTTLTATGSLIGTPDYMAPERISGGKGGPESDLWSLAMMLYVAVENHHPLRRENTLATLAAVLYEELPPPRRAGVLTSLLSAVLVKDPARRPGATVVDAMLAEAEDAPAPAPRTPVAADSGTTSFRLAPPAAPVPAPPPAYRHPPFTGPHPVQDSVPAHGPRAAVADSPPRAGHERSRRWVRHLAVGSSIVSTALLAVLLWNVLPARDADSKANGSTPPGATASGPGAPASTKAADEPAGSGSGGPAESWQDGKQVNLLTPEGIRTAVAALKAETGTQRMAGLTAYPEYVSAEVMVDGSKSRYDSWTYRPGRGVEKGLISGSVSSMESPFNADDFDWDAVPALFARAEKELRVKDVTSRYLVVEGADPTFGYPMRMSAYLSNAYSQSGYLTADHTGKVTKVMPNERA